MYEELDFDNRRIEMLKVLYNNKVAHFPTEKKEKKANDLGKISFENQGSLGKLFQATIFNMTGFLQLNVKS